MVRMRLVVLIAMGIAFVFGRNLTRSLRSPIQ